MMRFTTWAIAACLSWTAAALRQAWRHGSDPVASPVGDITLCKDMLGSMPPGMNLLQYGAGDIWKDPKTDADYAKIDGKPEEVVIEAVKDATDWKTNDAAAFSHLRNRNILFLGDSTIEELMWDTIFTLNESPADEWGWTDVPAKECHYQKCTDVCDGRDKGYPHQHYHMFGRCSYTTPECLNKMPQVKKLNVTFSFLWAASPFICCNGWPGLYGALANPQWMDLFSEYAARGPYDDIILSGGTHDFYAAQNEAQYRHGMAKFVEMLEPIGRNLIFVNPQGGNPNRLNQEILFPNHPRWRLIDRRKYSEHLHCNPVNYTLSYFHYRRTSECHSIMREIFNPWEVSNPQEVQ